MFKSLTHAARILRKSPGFTAVAVCSLAIGIGATSAMFSFADALLLRPLPVFEPSRIAAVTTANSAAFGTNNAISYPDYLDFRDRNRSFEGLLAASYATFGFSPNQATLPRMKFGLFVSGNFFRVLGVEPSLGRGFRDDEDQAEGRDPVVILGHDFWVSQFSGSRSVLGSKLRLNGIDFSVIGVAPESFTGIDQFLRPALFIPLAMSPRTGQANNLNRRDLRWLIVKGRLKPGVGVNQAQADLNAIASQLQKMYPQSNRNQRIAVQTELQLRAAQSPPDAALAAMLVLLSLCVLLVACANVAGLLLSRARARSREIAVRLAIGAGRGSLVRQLLLENLLLALLGGLAGVAIAYGGAAYFRRLPIPTDLPVVIDVALDHRVLWFTLAVSLLSTLLFGLTPALRATHPDLVPALKATDADSAGRRLWGRNLIVAGQVALSLVLLVVSAVLVRGFDSQLAQGPGFRTDHLFLTSFDTQLVHYSNDQTRHFYKELLDRTRSAPGVKSAALTSVIPMIGGDSTPIVPEGYQLPRGEQALTVFDAHVSDGFFDTMNIRLLKGRSFLPTDLPDTPRVAVVNEHLANHYWPKGDALGKRFHLGNAAGDLVQIVGIAKTTKYFWIAEPPLDYLYLPYTQTNGVGGLAPTASAALTVVAESDAPDPSTIAPVLREVVRGLDPNMPVYDVRTMYDLYTQRAVKTPNMIADSVAGLGLMGLILATVGLYGLIAYSVSRRTREIGIRMAIGADRQKVVQMILTQGLTLSSAGVAVGLLISFFVCRILTSALWIATFDATNPLLFAAIALPLLLITLLAAYAPARRASLIDPIRALREE